MPLSRSQPRQGRYGRLAIGLLVFIIYFNLMSAGKAWLVMVEQAEEVGAIDKERAEESLRQAEETLAAAAGDDEVVRNAAELRKRRAENRLRTLEKHR